MTAAFDRPRGVGSIAVRAHISCQILALFGLLFANSAARGQDPNAAATLSVDVKLVTLPVTVRDKHGQIVRNLTKDDFLLEEDGHPQTIRYFAQEANLPLTLGLLVDTSMSQRNVLDQERTASKSFLNQMLTAAKDQAFIIHFDREVELLQDLTSSHDKLQTALASLQTPRPDRDTGGGGESAPDSSPGGSHRMHGGTLLYDAVFLASDELMKKQQGRKALIILSDGVDRGSKESLPSAIEAAQRADTVVYSILFADNHQDHQQGGGFGRPGVGWPGGGWPGGGGSGGGGGGGRRGGGQRPSQEARPDGKKILERISKETGGRLYEVSKKETVDKIYTSIAEELRTQYSLGYTPDKADAAAGYHKIILRAKDKNLSVQTRDGYYADR
ncbi:MAG: von Willebrand factor, type [Candidatus Sulfotelmatobacter sp.]|nr:von Willebrand factor, type [Candidatus Sulfotelmatobacter sp.]